MAAAHHPLRGPGRTWPQRLIIAVGAFVSGCMLIGATGLGWGFWKLSHIGRVDVSLPAAADGAPENYLVVGSDSRTGGDPTDPSAGRQSGDMGQRSDTIMVLRINPRAKQATMLSLPRDLWVPVAGKGHGRPRRINEAYSLGKQTLVDTIQQDFGIPINHYLEVDFRGFQGLVQAIGGVPMWFDRAYRDSNSGLMIDHPGCTLLDGYGALAFARARHLEYLGDGHWRFDGTGDLGRISRQQLFIRRAIDRAVSKGLDNPLTLKRLVEVGAENLRVDKSLSLTDLLSLGRRFQNFNSTTLKTFTVPAAGFRTSTGASVLRLDDVGAQPLFNLFRDRPLDATLSESNVHVTVLNSSGRTGEAANVAGALLRAGFGVDRWANGSDLGHSSEARSVVRYAPGSQAAADLLVRHLSTGAERVEDRSLATGQVALFVGADFTTVQAASSPPPAGTAAPAATDSGSADASTASAPPPTTVIGRVPGDPPRGARCG